MRALVVTNMWPSPASPAPRRASCATRSTRCARSPASRSRSSPSRRAATCARRATCAAAPRRALRRRPRALRADRLAGARAARRAARRDAPRHRPAPPALGRHHARGAAVRRPRRRGQRRARARASPGAGRRAAASRCCPAASTLDRFAPHPARARRASASGLDPDGRCLLFPADPARAVKRVDRAREVAGERAAADARARSIPPRCRCGSTPPTPCSCPPTHEGFGLAVLEALACDVPVLATPVGVHPAALDGIAGTLCAPFDATAWRAALAPHLRRRSARRRPRPRRAVVGRAHGPARARGLAERRCYGCPPRRRSGAVSA